MALLRVGLNHMDQPENNDSGTPNSQSNMGMDSLLLTLHVVTHGGAGSDVPVWQRVVAYGDRLAAFSHAHSAIDPLDDFSGVTAHRG